MVPQVVKQKVNASLGRRISSSPCSEPSVSYCTGTLVQPILTDTFGGVAKAHWSQTAVSNDRCTDDEHWRRQTNGVNPHQTLYSRHIFDDCSTVHPCNFPRLPSTAARQPGPISAPSKSQWRNTVFVDWSEAAATSWDSGSSSSSIGLLIKNICVSKHYDVLLALRPHEGLHVECRASHTFKSELDPDWDV